MALAQAFQYRKGKLFCENVPLVRVAEEVGTPCYVYSKTAIIRNYRYFRSVFAATDPLICYAVKANSNLSILRILKEEGCGFDIVSQGEWHRLQQIGADPAKTVFSGVGKTRQELAMAIQAELLAINVESLQELETLAELARHQDRQPAVALRVNPDVNALTHPYIATGMSQHKFGIDLDQIPHVISMLRRAPHLRLVGLGFHIGSQILDIGPFLDSFRKLRELAAEFEEQAFRIEHLDLGGGIGIPYSREERLPDLKQYAELVETQRDHYRILLEPGRFIVGNTGALLNRVLYHKVNSGKHFVVVDAAMNDLIRPSLYHSYHEILALQARRGEIRTDVVGPVCETGDFFARDRLLPAVRQDDYLAIMNCGAYGFPLASNYNSRPRAAEVLVENGHFEVIRRRETCEDLIRGERTTS